MSASPPPGTPIPVGVLGATGTVGQRLLSLLDEHPWFRAASLMAGPRSAGRPYRAAVRWSLSQPIPAAVADLAVGPCAPDDPPPLVFSCLGGDVATDVERAFAAAGCLVVSNAASHRLAADVPLLVPEVNADHLALAARQDRGPGRILTNPNCSTIGLALALAPLQRAFGVERVHVVTLQAISGAGLPGVPSLAITDNVIPFIAGEEEKLATETRKILGSLGNDGIVDADILVSAQCNRVPVVDGHTLCVSVGLGRRASVEEVAAAWTSFAAPEDVASLPSAPRRLLHLLDEPDAPQPRRHRDLDGGMGVSIGRLRPCPLLDHRFVTLSHNTIRGAAGGALLVAELALTRGVLREVTGG